MDAIEALLTRRSIRRFVREPVPAATVDTLLAVLFSSPSAADARPWHFVVIDRPALLDALADAMPKCDMLREAPAAMLVCADPGLGKIPGFWPQDCAAAVENLLVAVHALGLGGVWIGLHPVADRETAVRRILHVPDDKVPFALVPFGPPAERLPREERRDAAKVHTNGW